MDYLTLKAEIEANPACAPYVITNEMTKATAAQARANDQAIADILSAGRTTVCARMISERGILADYAGGPIAADAVMTKLEGFAASAHPLASVVRRAVKFLAQPDGIDVGAPATRALLDQLAAGGVIEAQEAAHLKALAEVPDVITAADVSRALRGPWE